MHGISASARADDDFTMRTRRPRSSRLVTDLSARVAMAYEPPNQDGGAAVMCLSELENPGTAATVLGAFSVVFSTLVGIPQAYKIYRNRSARGISFLTLGLGNVGGFLYVLNLTILHYNQITLSMSKDFAFWLSAQRSLVFVWVELFNAISMLTIYPIAAYYVRDDPCPVRFEPLGIDWRFGMKDAVFYGFLLQLVVVLLAWFPAAVVFTFDGRSAPPSRKFPRDPRPPVTDANHPPAPSPGAHLTGTGNVPSFPRRRCEPLMVYGNLVGLLVAIIIVCKFLPQLHASLHAKGSHSLSYLTYGVDAVAGVVAWAQKFFITHERISSWLPPLFLHALEILVLSLNYYHDTRRRREGEGYAGIDKRDEDVDLDDPDAGARLRLGRYGSGAEDGSSGSGEGGRSPLLTEDRVRNREASAFL